MTDQSSSSQGPRIHKRNRPCATDQFADPVDPLVDDIDDGVPHEARSAPDQPDYAVGFGKPPVRTRFRPGQSGNPRGRPRGAKGLKTLVRETMTKSISVRTAEGNKRMPRIEAVLQRKFELAMKGNERAQSRLIELYGQAIPESVGEDLPAGPSELTAADEATLAAYRAMVLDENQSDAPERAGDDQ